MTKKTKLTTKMSLIAFSIAAANAVHAQEKQDTAPSAKAIEVISVTARKVEENLQQVPVSVTALTEKAMRLKGIEDISQVAREAPNVTLEQSRATNTTLTAYIRGIGQQDPLWGFEPGVGIYIDDVYFARPQAALLDVYDVERIEVLRGPQGSLYGKNTIGGAIKYVTKSARDANPLTLSGSVGSFQQKDLKLAGSHELLEGRLWVGAAVASLNRDGFGQYVGPINAGVENGNKDLLAYRFSLDSQLGDAVSFRVDFDKTTDDSNNRGGHRLTKEEVTGLAPLEKVFDTRSGISPQQKVVSQGVSGTLSWDLNDNLRFKSVTAKRDGSTLTSIDFDNQQLSLMEAPDTVYSDEQFSQELQLAYHSTDLQLVSGLYYFDGSADGAFDLDLFKGLFGSRLIGTRTIGSVTTKSTAIYAQGDYRLTERWQLTLGGRYSKDEKTTTSYFSQYNTPAGIGSYNKQLVASDFTRSPEWSKFTPKVGLNYSLTDAVMAYLSYSTGFKSGGVDPRANLLANARAGDPFNPEIVNTTELGIKSELFDDRMRLNVTLFDNDYTDQQVATSILIDSDGDGDAESFAGQVVNAGKSSAQGYEIESIVALTSQLQLNFTYGYIDAGFDEFLTIDPKTLQQVNVADSRVVANTPKTTLNLGLTYQFPLFDGMLSLNSQLSRRSKVHLFETVSPIDQDAVSLLDANLLWTSTSGQWALGLHGKNLTDKEYRTAGYYFPTLANSVIGYYGNPRTLTASLTYRFW